VVEKEFWRLVSSIEDDVSVSAVLYSGCAIVCILACIWGWREG